MEGIVHGNRLKDANRFNAVQFLMGILLLFFIYFYFHCRDLLHSKGKA